MFVCTESVVNVSECFQQEQGEKLLHCMDSDALVQQECLLSMSLALSSPEVAFMTCSDAKKAALACRNITPLIYEGRPINKLQNGVILLIFKI